MQDKKQIIKTIKVLIICVICFVTILVIYHYFMNVLQKPHKEEVKKISYERKEVNENYQNPSYCDGGYYIIEEKENNEVNTLILNDDLSLIEKINGSSDNVFCLYDRYYLVKIDDNYILKRNNSIVAKVDMNSPKETVYQDTSSKNISYINKLYISNIVNKELAFTIGNYAYAKADEGILINTITGQVIDKTVKNAYQVEINNEIKYLYVESVSNYLLDINNDKKLLNYYKLVFDNVNSNIKVRNASTKYFIFQSANKMGLMDINGNVIIGLDNQNIKLETNDGSYFAVKRNEKYGLINSFGNVVLDFTYDDIYVTDDFIFTLKDKVLDIYTSNMQEVSKGEYKTLNDNLDLTKYDEFYQIKDIITDNNYELIITKDKKINLVKELKPINYYEYFYDKKGYYVVDDEATNIYEGSDKKVRLMSNINGKLDKIMLLDFNKIYLELKTRDDKIRYDYYRLNSGKLDNSYAVTDFNISNNVFKVKNLIFSDENKNIKIYVKDELYDELENAVIRHIKDDYYLLNMNDKNAFVYIKQN